MKSKNKSKDIDVKNMSVINFMIQLMVQKAILVLFY